MNGDAIKQWQGRHTALVALVVVCQVLLIGGRLDEMPVGGATDDAHYVEMARSLAEGRGAVLHVGPDAPDRAVFPPGFPLLLTPLARLAPTSLTLLKLVPVLAALLLVPLCLAWPDPEASPGRRIALAAVVALNPWTVAHAGRIVSDLPFTALVLGVVVVAPGGRSPSSRNHGRWLLVGALVGVAVLVRTVGLTLLAAVLTHLVLDRRWGRMRAVAGMAAAVVLLPLLLGWSSAVLPLGNVYGDQLLGHHQGAVSRLLYTGSQCVGYLNELPALLVPVFGKAMEAAAEGLGFGRAWSLLRMLTGLALAMAVAASLVAGLRRADSTSLPAHRFWGLFLAWYGLALLGFEGYPDGVQLRLLLPVLPAVAWYSLAAADRWRWSPSRPRLTWALVLAVMLAGACAHNGWRLARPLRGATDVSGRGFVDPEVGADWIRDHTAETDVVMAQAPLERHIHLRRPVVGTGPLQPDSLADRVRRHDVVLILTGPHANHLPRRLDAEGEELRRLLQSDPARYPPRFALPREALWVHGVAEDPSF